ncbi:GGDEF domain-containing protein [Pseudomonas sp. Gutcm_11s]|uniref:GGDEF domain-containing protein n=1 Tax=Pseudomonas sp. Gutcm_11s TaxID=3026088 RepID=UPI00235EB1A3|nr:diguanylate cyclase [Pseudomonas sp. Gutcm_11s]MDD0842691.1 diguanylate cyclase [Pseudomonas sp. Gutcm_11s]
MTADPQALRLIRVVQELSMAKDVDRVAEIVRSAARELTGADGATFVLRDGQQCFYRDEDAISPLWKGQRFPLSACISGWAMLNRRSTVIPDIYADSRIPHAAYRPTFVKSLVMVPIRTLEPIGAIGTYWATPHEASEQQVMLLQALADSTSIAMENVQVYAELERRVADRTLQLVEVNQRLQAEMRERERMAAEVRQLSLTDELTGLSNRRGFLLLAERELESARRRGGRCLLLYADLDYLKQANDRFGHAAGDAMLIDAAQLLRSLFRSTDVVARLGGDEFVVLASDYTSSEEVLLRLHRALDTFRRTTGRPLSLSVGLAESGLRGGSGLDTLLQQADSAMYANKCTRHERQQVVNQ